MTGVELESEKAAAMYRALGDYARTRGGGGLSYFLNNTYYALIEGLSGAASNPASIPAILAAPFTGALSLKLMGVSSLTGATLATRAGVLGAQALMEGAIEATSVATIQHHLEMKNPDADFDRVAEAVTAGISAAGAVTVLGGLGQAVGGLYRSVKGVKNRNGIDFVDGDTQLSDAPPEVERTFHEANAKNFHEQTHQEAADDGSAVHKIMTDKDELEKAKQAAAQSKEKDPAAGKEATPRGSADAPEPQPQPAKTLEDYLPDADTASGKLEENKVTVEYTQNGGQSTSTIEMELPSKIARKVWAAAGDQRKVETKNHILDLLTALDEAGVLPKTKENLQVVKKAAKEYRKGVEQTAKAAAEVGGESVNGKTIEVSPMDALHRAIEEAKARRADEVLDDVSVEGTPAGDITVQVPTIEQIDVPDKAFDVAGQVARTTNMGMGEKVTSAFNDLVDSLNIASKEISGETAEDTAAQLEARVDELFDSAREELDEIAADVAFQHQEVPDSQFSLEAAKGIGLELNRILDSMQEGFARAMDGVTQRLKDTTVVDPQKNIIDVDAAHGAEQVRIKTQHEEAAEEMARKGFFDEAQAEKAKSAMNDMEKSTKTASECGVG
jgi:hypothetical protein